MKADIALRDGRIAGIGKAGNPDVQPGVDIVIGPGTEVIAGEGKIVTAGGIDVHVHYICPQQIEEAPVFGRYYNDGRRDSDLRSVRMQRPVPSGPWNIRRMLQAADGFPMNLGFFTAKAMRA